MRSGSDYSFREGCQTSETATAKLPACGGWNRDYRAGVVPSTLGVRPRVANDDGAGPAALCGEDAICHLGDCEFYS